MTNNPTDDAMLAIERYLNANLLAEEDEEIDFGDDATPTFGHLRTAFTTLIEYRQQVQDLKDALDEVVNSGRRDERLKAADRLLATLTKESRV